MKVIVIIAAVVGLAIGHLLTEKYFNENPVTVTVTEEASQYAVMVTLCDFPAAILLTGEPPQALFLNVEPDPELAAQVDEAINNKRITQLALYEKDVCLLLQGGAPVVR